jgi:hypothetical protein
MANERLSIVETVRQFSRFNAKVEDIAGNKQLTPQGQATALALLISLNAKVLKRAEEILRAQVSA